MMFRLIASSFFHLFRGADICKKCWKFMVVAMKIVDRALEGKIKYNVFT